MAAVLIFAGVLMPALGFFNVYYFLFTQVSDHFQYHACPALIALGVACAARSWQWVAPAPRAAAASRLLRYAAIGGVLLPLAIRSHDTCLLYESEASIYRDVIAKNPASWAAYCQLGVWLAVQQQYEEALAMGRKAVQLARTGHACITTTPRQFSSGAGGPLCPLPNSKKPSCIFNRPLISILNSGRTMWAWDAP